MKFDLSSQNTKILQEQKKHRQWVMIFLGLSVTVILGTVAALKLYGQALTHKVKVLDCQAKVHEHTDECYVYDEEKEEDVLVCGFAGYLAHVHNDDCRDENGRLVCPLEEIEPHKHVDACFEEQQVLVCELEGIEPAQGDNTGTAANQPVKTPDGGEESQPVKTPESESQPEGNTEAASQPAEETAAETEAPTAPAVLETTLVCIMAEHTHTDACYGEAEPACTMTEHTHGDGCYERALTCDKNEHQHDDSCNDEEGNLICELEEHAHEDGCYEEKLICEEEEHSHTDACAAGEATLTCEAEEHTHTDACYEQVAARTEAPETTAPAETKAPETKAPETTAAETTAAPTTVAAETTAAPETTAEAGTHIHTADCYETKLVPICGKLENHTHDDDCYDENGKLICELLQLEEHRHNKDCFKTVELTSEEIAALNAGAKLHIHHDDCYDENGELICGHEETHIHGEKCYDRNGKLICGHEEAHVHSDGCYDKNGDIICGLEVVLHEHRDECYDENGKLICDHAHIHEESCFDEDGNMTCDFEEVGDYLWTCEEEDYIVTVKFNQEAEIPGNAKLLAEQITADGENQEYFAQREEEYKEAMKDETAEMRALLHIGFYVENKEAKENEEKLIEIEPKKPVTVTVQFLDEDGLKEGEPITVVHFADEGTELLDGGQAEDNRATFEMNGFSEIAIGYGDEGAKAEVSVSGNEIEEDNEETIHLDDSFGYEDEAFHITFHVKGEAILPKDAINEEKKDENVSSENTSSDEKVTEPVGGEEEKDTKAESEEELKSEETKMDKGSEETVSNKEDEPSETDSDEAVEEEKESAAEAESSEEETMSAVKRAAGQRAVAAVGESEDEEESPATGESKEVINEKDKITDGETALDSTDQEMTTDDRYNDNSGGQETGRESEDHESADIIDEGDGPEEGTGQSKDPELLTLDVAVLDEENASFLEMKDFLENKSDVAGDLLDLTVLEYHLYYDGQELDLSPCIMTAEVTPKNALLEEVKELPGDAVVSNAETGILLSVLKDGEEGIEESDSEFISSQTADMSSINGIELQSNRMAVAKKETANPKFEVQYYAWLDVANTSGSESNALTVIDTSKKANGNKAVLPSNGIVPKTKNIYLEPASNGKHKVAVTKTLTKVYTTKEECEYIKEPNLTYFNKLYENGNYRLSKIWILKAGKDKTSIQESDWDVYEPSTTHFTNRQEAQNIDPSQPEKTVLITDDTVIRLVFEPTETEYKNAVNFYDYDITDGKGNTRINNESCGINSKNNYSGVGSKFAFGNANTGSGLQGETWNDNYLNQYNRTGGGYKGCTFGLASGLVGGKIQYAKGICVPNLFNDGNASGKTSYDDGQYKLNFDRKGDTYTLSAVEGAGLGELQYFSHPSYKDKNGSIWKTHTGIWTNDFWPMDSRPGADGKTGTARRYTNNWGNDSYNAEETYKTNGTVTNYPSSDDSIPHNNMFGMQYAVDFELTKDYCGPLEYYFFGDDDMWVFLTDSAGKSQLVIDIGGVHSSVGEYVDLWDYIPKGQSEGNYKLSFFYTERGLSGSTCYMQFTLPSVSSVTPEQNTGSLMVKKELSGFGNSVKPEDVGEFQFDIKLMTANGDILPDEYSYTRYKNDGTTETDLIIYNGGHFELAGNEYIIIKYLPKGTKYEIIEDNQDLYDTSVSIEGTIQEGVMAEGTIGEVKQYDVIYTNHRRYKLPETGGSGTIPFSVAGIVSICSGMVYMYTLKRRKFKKSL